MKRDSGNWVRVRGGALIWDPWDMDAPPESDPLPRILEQLSSKPPPSVTGHNRDGQRQPRRSGPTRCAGSTTWSSTCRLSDRLSATFTAYVEAKLAGKALGETTDPASSAFAGAR
jgi:hypothetical protein